MSSELEPVRDLLEPSMPYPKPFVRMSWIFAIHGTEEIAETSLHVSKLGTAPFDAPAFVASLVAADGLALAGYMTTMLNGSSNVFNWAEYSDFVAFKAADMDTTGHETAAPFVWNSPTPYDHGAGLQTLPQSSVVLSLRSGGTFGNANYGRMYLPHTRLALGSVSPKATAAETASAAALGRTFVNSVNTLSNTHSAGAGVVNISQVGAGTVKGVAQVAIGDVVDTQRRRRNRLQETYAYVTV